MKKSLDAQEKLWYTLGNRMYPADTSIDFLSKNQRSENMTLTKKYNAALYARVSKEDGSKVESESIANQIALMKSFVEQNNDIEIKSIRADDGFSGVNLERPQFRLMEEEIEQGLVNCVIVKDLSRLARNFIESGKTIHDYITYKNVRFIAINDHIDSLDPSTVEDNLIIPIKNLMNDAYLADLSVKIRSQFAVRRKKGDFVSPFVTYGYRKDPHNKKKLVIDEDVAPVIESIFKLKLEGWSAVAIADKLNQQKIPSPSAHKQACGINFSTPFQVKETSLWASSTISRMLKNPIFMGTLVQGKTCTPNHKVKSRITKPETDWAVVENNHEPIINKEIFEVVQTLLSRDARKNPEQLVQFPLSGAVFCGDCHNSMTRKNNGSKFSPKYIFVCNKYKQGKGCSRHGIAVETVEKAVLSTINAYIETLLNVKELLKQYDNIPFTQKELEKNNTLLQEKLQEHHRFIEKKTKTYEMFQQDEIDQEDFNLYSSHYQKSITSLESEIEKVKKDIEALVQGKSEVQQWLQRFTEEQGATELTRKLVFSLIERVNIYEDNKITIVFNFKDEYETIVSYLNTMEKLTSKKKEVV